MEIEGGSNPVTMLVQGILDHTSGSTYFYGGGGASGLTVMNSGTIESAGGGQLTLGYYNNDSITNAAGGTIEADGGTLYLDSYQSNVTNLAGGTLAGGTWIASNGGALEFTSATPIATNAAATTLVLDGAASNIYSGPSPQLLEHTLTTNDGTLEVLTNRNFPATNAIANSGTIELGGGSFTAPSLTNSPGSTLSGFGTFNPTGGVTVGNGVLVSPGNAAANLYINTLSFGTNGLNLGTGGAYTVDIANSSASSVAGVDNDTINVAGTLMVSATPVSPFTISLESVNYGTGMLGMANFSSAGTYQWTLLSATSISGFNASDFTINTSSFQNGLGGGDFNLTSNGSDIFLNFTPVPEPSTWALMGMGVAAAALAALRRRRCRA